MNNKTLILIFINFIILTCMSYAFKKYISYVSHVYNKIIILTYIFVIVINIIMQKIEI